MTEVVHDSTAPANPFQSPVNLETPSESDPNSPSPRTFWICLILGSVVNLAASIPTYTNTNYTVLTRLSWLIPDLCFGLAYGMALALLTHAARFRQWATLMPGHWRLIAFLSTWFIYAGSFAAPLAALAVYLAFALITKERLVWRVYAWLCVLIYALELSQTIFVNLISGEIFAANTEMGGDPPDIGDSPMLIAFMVIAFFVMIFNLATLVALIAGVATDIQSKIRRDAYHYLGLILVLVLPMSQWIWQIVVGGGLDTLYLQ
ncbi:hypothetical protein [Bremerella sp. P1]|uniref:hypothetical protein n=1 Tax=Bremerella sp. P1 TaxID=3026424 RepID=UPI002367F2C3|nr:hypothetical protein [Bremerella sp. P1]WDI43327.1 hypothetical protein PSR63_05120 [Bremerella sp. P1]